MFIEVKLTQTDDLNNNKLIQLQPPLRTACWRTSSLSSLYAKQCLVAHNILSRYLPPRQCNVQLTINTLLVSLRSEEEFKLIRKECRHTSVSPPAQHFSLFNMYLLCFSSSNIFLLHSDIFRGKYVVPQSCVLGLAPHTEISHARGPASAVAPPSSPPTRSPTPRAATWATATATATRSTRTIEVSLQVCNGLHNILYYNFSAELQTTTVTWPLTSLDNLFSSFINAIFFKVKVGYNELISLLNTVISIQTFSEPKWKVKEARRNQNHEWFLS